MFKLPSRKKLKKILIFFLGFGLIFIVLCICSNLVITKTAHDFVYTDVAKIPARKVGLLLGASVKMPDGRSGF